MAVDQKLAEMMGLNAEQQKYPCSPHCEGYLRELRLRAAVSKFLDGRMKEFSDSRAVDDDLVILAAAISNT